jgi:hypothetical protein
LLAPASISRNPRKQTKSNVTWKPTNPPAHGAPGRSTKLGLLARRKRANLPSLRTLRQDPGCCYLEAANSKCCFTGQSSSGRGEYPRKRQNSQKLRLGCLAMPAAIGIRAGQILVAKNLHCFDFRQRGIRASLLYVDIVAALWAFKNNSIG